ncbi:MAG TPA: hypothetical protein VLF91_04595 [Candidatus Saccharimonadales bacterium]|nr:hypothetical protein [Candidatus Saccharimonadales bacterium]
MDHQRLASKRQEWLKRYIPAEILGTAAALAGAWSVYTLTHSFAAATASGWTSEGIAFYGYFICAELLLNGKRYSSHPVMKRVPLAVAAASTNLLVEFLPAEVFDNFIVRPFLMFFVPQHIHPYPVGFLAGKFSADVLFYALAIIGYETRKRWLRR